MNTPAEIAKAGSMRLRGEPQVFVSVAYDFEYLAEDGKRVFMKERETLLLINKTNHDWWQVRLSFFFDCKFFAAVFRSGKPFVQALRISLFYSRSVNFKRTFRYPRVLPKNKRTNWF